MGVGWRRFHRPGVTTPLPGALFRGRRILRTQLQDYARDRGLVPAEAAPATTSGDAS